MLQFLFLPTALLLGASVFDIKTRKVPNYFVIVGFIISVSYLIIAQMGTASDAVFGFTTALFLMLPLYLIKALGAGDVKVFSIFGLLTNSQTVIDVFIFSLFCAALIGILKALFNKSANNFIYNFKQILSLKKPNETTVTKIPYTIALLMGWFCHIVYNYYGRIL